MLAGAGYFLLSRRATQIGIDIFAILACSMGATAAVSALLAVNSGLPLLGLSVADPKMLFVLIIAIACCYGGNIYELRGVAVAPNPGYVLAINKSFAAVTLVAAWWLFGSQMEAQKILGVALIVIFQIVARAPWQAQNISAENDGSWARYSVLSLIGLAGLSLAGKYLMLAGMDRLVFLVFLAGPVFILFAANWRYQGKKVPRTREALALLAGVGLMSAMVNLSLYSAIAIAPNLGYVNAINAAQIGIVTILSARLLGDELTLSKVAGIVGVTVGLLFIAI